MLTDNTWSCLHQVFLLEILFQMLPAMGPVLLGLHYAWFKWKMKGSRLNHLRDVVAPTPAQDLCTTKNKVLG